MSYCSELSYSFRRWCEHLLIAFVWKLPKKLVYWCAIRVAAEATAGKYGNEMPDTVSIITALTRWEKDKKI